LLGLEASFDRRLGLVTLVGNPNVVAMAEQYLRQYDLRKRQVALAITILDLDLSNNSSLTSSFAYRSGDNFIVNDAGRLFGNLGNTGQQPPFNVPDGDFVGYLQAQITSQTAKILANPTLIMQEGEEVGGSQVGDFSAGGVGSAVRVGASVVTNFNVTTDSNGNIICNPTTTTAGLTMLAKVDKVDDNGFVTFVVAPNISAPVGSQTVPGCGIINILNSRALTTSRVRVRDGQTLILTGVISDEDRAVVTKWPILGDIPIIGSLFRSTGRERTKRELVILVTPRIINDEQGGAYGYGYRPVSDDARQLIYGKGMR
jgi:type IV pilus assembly protein PilQ